MSLEEGSIRRRLRGWRGRSSATSGQVDERRQEMDKFYSRLRDIETYLTSPSFRERRFPDMLEDPKRVFTELVEMARRAAGLATRKVIDDADFRSVWRGISRIIDNLTSEIESAARRELSIIKEDLYRGTGISLY